MKIFIAVVLVAACYAAEPCPNSLCKWREDGFSARVSNDHPGFFFQCSNWIAYCFDCPANTVFDNHLRVCVNPHKSKPALPKCPQKLCKWQPVGALVSYPGKPTYYVQCTNSGAVCRVCPAGLVFSNGIDVCVRPASGKKH
ncbi:chondroitin proteoglycan-2-like [Clytia hemisphaerica]|uniref:Chitin-binding type-2 domain-containing protein n=1 Tax=Clytia hemisphaerica TaxID=252671 RepID=A0A7M5WXB3_9CNID